jgi:hypothetical protein
MSPEIYTPKEGRTIKGIIDVFVASLLAGGCKMVSDKGYTENLGNSLIDDESKNLSSVA